MEKKLILTEAEQRGDNKHYKLMGDRRELENVSRWTHEPIKEQNGYNPEHIDLPPKKAGKVRGRFWSIILGPEEEDWWEEKEEDWWG